MQLIENGIFSLDFWICVKTVWENGFKLEVKVK